MLHEEVLYLENERDKKEVRKIFLKMQMADPTAGKIIPLRDYIGKIYEIVFPPPVWT